MIGALVAALAAGAGAATASAATVAHSASKTNTMVLRGSAEAKGKYEIIVWVRSRSKHSRIVQVFLTGQREKSVRANPWWGARVYYELKLKGTKLTIVTQNAAPAVQVRAWLISKNKSAPAPTITTTSGNAATSTSATPNSTTTAPPAPPPPPATPDPYGPYTTLTWQDNFAQDFASPPVNSQPNQLPNSADWTPDTWGGCGGNTLSTDVTNASGASLTSNGLALNAVETGPNSGQWTAAQVDDSGKPPFAGAFGPGETIEARMDMPYGQGLCGAFWMLGNDNANQGEIDVVEAPAFGSTATDAFFTLHGPGDPSQKYESDETALGSLSGTWHNYAVTWTSSEIIWSIDGVPYATANASSLAVGSSWSPFDGTFYLIFDIAVGGWACADQPVGPGCEPPSSATMYVQWVKSFN